MVILDVAIVGVAAPSIEADLGFSQQGLQWIVSAYAIAFGGLLLLGGRAADLLGRRRVFMAGTALFAGSSLLAGFAWSAETLVVARVVQGLGAAVITPAALSIVTTIFGEGASRNKALGAWNAVGAVGGTTGLVLGGVLTDSAGWEWLFFVNVPVGAAVLAAAPALLPESRGTLAPRGLDVPGAVTVTASLVLIVYALVEAPDAGWGSAQTGLLLAGAAALLAAFGAIERRSRAPLFPLRLLRMRTLVGGNLLGVLAGSSIFSWFFVATLYLQQVLEYTPLEAGLAFLAGSLGGLAGSAAGQAIATKAGLRPVALAGAALLTAGLVLQLGLGVEAGYAADLLPAFALMGIGTGFGFVASAIAALTSVEERHAGLASGLVNTSQQVGGAIGVAIVTSVAVSRTQEALADGGGAAAALTEGFQAAFAAAIAFPVLAALVAALLLPGTRAGVRGAEPAPAPAGD
jgi:EmrB/QacA subfamily drug resistance transporter